MRWSTWLGLLILIQTQTVAKEAKEQDKKVTAVSGLVLPATTGRTDSWYQLAVGAGETGTTWSQQGQRWLKKAKAKAKGKAIPQRKKKGKGTGTSTGGARYATTTTRAGERNATTVACPGKCVNGRQATSGRSKGTRTVWKVPGSKDQHKVPKARARRDHTGERHRKGLEDPKTKSRPPKDQDCSRWRWWLRRSYGRHTSWPWKWEGRARRKRFPTRRNGKRQWRRPVPRFRRRKKEGHCGQSV